MGGDEVAPVLALMLVILGSLAERAGLYRFRPL
jgi:hypothetical protein